MFRGTDFKMTSAECRITTNVSLRSWPRGESPQPHAENSGDNQRNPAYPHWDREASDGDLGLVDQPQQMANGKNAEKHAGNAQSSCW